MPGDGGDSSTWAILVAAGSGERLGADRPKAFVALGGRVLLAESLERLDAQRLDRRGRRRGSRRVGGGRDRARRGARRLEGGRGRHRRRDAGRVGPRRARGGAGRRARRARPRRRPAARRRRRDRAGARLRSPRATTASCPACRSPTRSSASSEGVVAETVDRALARRRADAAGVRCDRRSGPPIAATEPIDATDCASLVEARGGRIRVVEGDVRLLKITTAADLALVESWL